MNLNYTGFFFIVRFFISLLSTTAFVGPIVFDEKWEKRISVLHIHTYIKCVTKDFLLFRTLKYCVFFYLLKLTYCNLYFFKCLLFYNNIIIYFYIYFISRYILYIYIYIYIYNSFLLFEIIIIVFCFCLYFICNLYNIHVILSWCHKDWY
jgi:hypothetical protein